MNLSLDGRRALVGASTSGLGLACATALADEGALVVVSGRDEGRARRAAEEIGPPVQYIVEDLSRPGSSEELVREATRLLGGVDILVANAPGPAVGDFAHTTPADYARALDLSLMTVVRMCHEAVPAMRARGWGRVVAVTSVAARQPISNLILSNTARAGATGFLKTLAREVAGDGVTVNSVQPGLHATARVESVYGAGLERETRAIPAGRLGDPDDFAALVAFLCSDRAGYITGAAIPVDGGVHQGLQ